MERLNITLPEFSVPVALLESGKCALTAALNRVWAEGGAVNSLSHSWRLVGTTPPVVNTLQGEGGEGAVRAGWGSLRLSRSGLGAGCPWVPTGRAAQPGWGDFWDWPQGSRSRSFPGTYDWAQHKAMYNDVLFTCNCWPCVWFSV